MQTVSLIYRVKSKLSSVIVKREECDIEKDDNAMCEPVDVGSHS